MSEATTPKPGLTVESLTDLINKHISEATPKPSLSVEGLVDLINKHMGGAHFCMRVWSAWGIGTMSSDDFVRVDETEAPVELAQEITKLLPATPTIEHAPAGSVIAGALFDFAGYLTTLDKSVTVGASEPSSPMVHLLEGWAEKRGLNLSDANVQDWNKRTAPAAKITDEDLVNACGVKGDGSSDVLGKALMPPKMKARDLVREQFGAIDEDAGNDAAYALWTCEALLGWLEKVGLLNTQLSLVKQ